MTSSPGPVIVIIHLIITGVDYISGNFIYSYIHLRELPEILNQKSELRLKISNWIYFIIEYITFAFLNGLILIIFSKI